VKYVSTRGGMTPQPFTDILLEGLAPDGGLAVPERYPRFSAADLARLRPLGYRELAHEVLSAYMDDLGPGVLQALIGRTYTARAFGSDAITPVSELEPGLFLLHASNGPTLAFKDIALQLLGNLFEHVLDARAATLNVLGATSGDTGPSAEYALRGKRGVAVFMLSPHGRMSPFQAAQMYALSDPNVFNLAIDGVFDDCQDIVKAIASDAAFKREHRLGAINSINWARVAAQVVYYFKGYFAATAGKGGDDQPVCFAVPSGNFGNVLAGHVARAMGLPIARLIVATNENDVLDEFFRSGRYRVRSARETRSTSSPSMDISKASNFERFIFDLAERDPDVVRTLWAQVDRDGGFDIAATPLARALRASGFDSGRSTHADRIATIRDVAKRCNVVIDPHTADGIKVGRERRLDGMPLICIETALPAKFAATVREALGEDPPRPAAYAMLERLPQRFTRLPADAAAVRDFVAAHALAASSTAST
jgi:threonine synthase